MYPPCVSSTTVTEALTVKLAETSHSERGTLGKGFCAAERYVCKETTPVPTEVATFTGGVTRVARWATNRVTVCRKEQSEGVFCLFRCVNFGYFKYETGTLSGCDLYRSALPFNVIQL